MSNESKTKSVIPNYEITFSAKNVTPKQRDFFYDLLTDAYDDIVKTLSVEDAGNTSIGETKVSETDWSSPSDWVVENEGSLVLETSWDWIDKKGDKKV
jgi:hypothetical protein